MRILALDLGARRIGLALSDPDASLAFPAGFLERKDPSEDLARLCALVEERGVGVVVVGLPVHMNGRAGPEAESARRFASELARATGLRVDLLDERWTTVEAERRLREGPRRKGRRRERGAVDAAAATVLLQTYLAQRRAASEKSPAP